MSVSKNRGGPPKSSILIGFSIINHPFWGTPIFGNTHIAIHVGKGRSDTAASGSWPHQQLHQQQCLQGGFIEMAQQSELLIHTRWAPTSYKWASLGKWDWYIYIYLPT